MHNANKRSAVLNSARRERPSAADPPPADTSSTVVFRDTAAYGASCAETPTLPTPGGAVDHRLWRCRSAVVVMARVDPVLYAMSGALSRRAVPTTGNAGTAAGRCNASATAAVQAAWAVPMPISTGLRCGTGDYIDFSRFDAVMALILSSGVGRSHGIRSTGRWHGPRNPGRAYSIYLCRTIRTVLRMPRQGAAAPLVGGA